MGPGPGGSRAAGDRVRRPGAGRVGPDPGRARFPGQGAGLTAPRGYAIGYPEDVDTCPEIAEYLKRIEATMASYGGRFLVHGGRLVVHEETCNTFPYRLSSQSRTVRRSSSQGCGVTTMFGAPGPGAGPRR
ncbi:DUF1330 domain-containing protein [Streptomyces sp. NPDC002265]|uniref:DUF1330 domain-containing protein n=1 Tax=Streptomyces sp. NPDC002265 TaxID=3154415 RepID=UPI00331695B0